MGDGESWQRSHSVFLAIVVGLPCACVVAMVLALLYRPVDPQPIAHPVRVQMVVEPVVYQPEVDAEALPEDAAPPPRVDAAPVARKAIRPARAPRSDRTRRRAVKKTPDQLIWDGGIMDGE